MDSNRFSFRTRLFSGAASLLFLFLASSLHAADDEEARLLRFPAIHGDQIVFGYAGDLYTVSSKGGVARRLTSDIGYEMFPRFSPDGQSIAFTGQYDGNTEVYLMTSSGGVPKRLTYTATLGRDDVADRMGPNNIVMTWRDDRTVVYRSRRTQWNPFKGELTLASVDGGLPEVLPLPRGGWCSYSPDGKQLAYNRVFREFRTWKRYRGGQADEIWIYDFETKKTEKITDNPAQDVFPMWHGDKIYFASDRGDNRRMNLFVYDTASKAARQLTRFADFDVKFPSLGDEAIVFENGGYLYRLDLATEEAVKVPVQIHEDFAISRGGLEDVSKSTSRWDISPDGARAVIGARGDVFTVPAKHGPTRNLTRSSGVHDRDPAWSPDGKWIACISDASGEDEIWVRSQDGSGTPDQLTSHADTYKYAPEWSPDSKRLLWSDKKNRLQFVDLATKEVTLVNKSDSWEIRRFAWSPDSQWIVFTRPEVRRFPNIYLYSVDSKKTVQVTDGWFDVGEAAFSSDGKYLFFVSERNFKPTFSPIEPNFIYQDMQNVFLISLAKDVKSPFAPKSDEVKVAEEKEPRNDKKPSDKTEAKEDKDEKKKDAEADEKKGKEKTEVVVKIDEDGLPHRIAMLPTDAATYSQLGSVGDKLFYRRKAKLYVYDLDKEKETELGEFDGYRISADHKKMLVRSKDTFAIVDLPSGKIDTKDKTLSLDGLKVHLDRHAEWTQIYNECWRQMRDFVYDPSWHGVDWAGLRERYAPLIAHVQHRADLTYIIGELIGELNLGHCYVGGGDVPKVERVQLGLLGAKLERDPSGFYKIDEILPGQNWDKKLRSPLTEIGVDVKAGEYIVAVNGQPTDEMTDIYASLVGKAGQQVTLRVNSEPKAEGARDETVIPTDDEQPLYYLKWVLGNIEKVSQATDGKIGYVHIPDMGTAGLNEFVKLYYAQLNKQGIIVDCRGNGGGFVSPQIIERLRREPVEWTVARNGEVDVDPSGQVLGPKVLLIDEFSASDGDIVAYRFRKYKLGPIIGKRSWGGVVGIRGTLPLLDGGYLMRPEFSRFDLAGKEWIMEGKGVEPDIVVDNDPAHEFAGVDDQLNRAIEEIKVELAKNPVTIPAPPPYPNKVR